MISLFDTKKLLSLLKDFYQITGIRITVFDENLHELIAYPSRVAPYCEIIRSNPSGLAACKACDRTACAVAAKRRGTHVYRCHAGFTEAAAPLYIGEVLAGYLLIGHVFPYASAEEGWKVIEAGTRGLQVNAAALKTAVFEAKQIPEDAVRSAAHILRAVASYLIMERIASLKQDPIAVRLDRYLSEHFTERLQIDALCKALGIGKTQLYKLSHELYGCGVAQRIRALRIGLAKELLSGSASYTLDEISARCGYGDYNYFIAVFSREVGCPPGKWRNKQFA